jgi:hypothetical protein
MSIRATFVERGAPLSASAPVGSSQKDCLRPRCSALGRGDILPFKAIKARTFFNYPLRHTSPPVTATHARRGDGTLVLSIRRRRRALSFPLHRGMQPERTLEHRNFFSVPA